MIYYSTLYESPVGTLCLACTDDGLVGLWFAGQKYYGGRVADRMTQRDDCPIFDHARNWLDRYFAGEKPNARELPLAPMGTEFQQSVWKILTEIPYGETITYGEIAQKLGRAPMSCRAVGGAVGHNPISIIIPCHRVIGANGELTGFAAGIEAKVKLLALESGK